MLKQKALLIIISVIILCLVVSGIMIFLIYKKSGRKGDTQIKYQKALYSLTANDLKFNINNFPQIDGSTSNQPVLNLAFCKLTGITCLREQDPDTKELFVYPKLNNSSETETYDNKVKTSKTHEAYLSLINKKTDLILVASEPSEEEMAEAEKQNIKFEITPVALDAFVFMVHESNEIENLSVGQIRSIYSGKVTNWKDVGGKDQKLTPYARNTNSGSEETMKRLVMKELNMTKVEPQFRIKGMMGLLNMMNNDKTSIGYSFYFYKNMMTNSDNVKIISIDGIQPNAKTISNRKYPLTTNVLIVTRKGMDENSNAINLKKWLLSPEGQKVFEEAGYIKMYE